MSNGGEMYLIGSNIEWVMQQPEKMITSEIIKQDEDTYTIRMNIPIPNIQVFKVENIGVINGKP